MKPEPQKQTLLRKRAEERLASNESAATEKVQPVNAQRLVHELQVHQIELEMQNDQLRQSRSEVESALEQITNLYDLAPVSRRFAMQQRH